ncbi:MAG TPA: hypothetical protein VLE19_07385, partial [Pyrinomonadaceae bacterium]|nr:hypothetical protein [Pyrinomonadaceae bacterium]
PPPDLKLDDSTDKFAAVQNDFNTPKRQNDALIRTVVSPDGRRVLALYGTDDEPGSAFRIDLYNSDGQFLRNMIPPTISCVFPETVSWSPDGSFINFIAHKRSVPAPSPTPLEDAVPDPNASPLPSPSVAPVFAPVASFNTEQIYISNRDGDDLKPLTSREGLIYFYFVWAPDGHAMVALACKEDEWNARERQYKLPAGRPRLIEPDGKERLLDDSLTDALPVWSPDAAKVATAFDTDLAIYDAASAKPTQARLRLGEQLISASVVYEEKTAISKAEAAKNSNAKAPSSSPTPTSTQPSIPASFNPIVRLEWLSPERIYFQTAFVRLMPSEAINTFQRWHLLNLSAQSAVLK